MTKANLVRIVAGLAITSSGTAFAQGWTPAAEVVGQPIQVTTNGVTNTVTLSPGGQATIASPGEGSSTPRGRRPIVSYA